MLWLFPAGTVAAARQLRSIVIVTLMFAILSRSGFVGPLIANRGSGHIAAAPILSVFYLLTAVNSAITRQDVIDRTARRIRHASRQMAPMAPHQVIEHLKACLWLATIATAVLTFMQAPAVLMVISGSLGFGAVAAIGWPAVMSIGMAYFGANGFAAQQALPPSR